MKTRTDSVFSTQARAGMLALLAVVAVGAGCYEPCPWPEAFESGRYEVTGLSEGEDPPAASLLEAVIGAELVVDRDAGEATLRYRRDATTYEATFRFEPAP